MSGLVSSSLLAGDVLSCGEEMVFDDISHTDPESRRYVQLVHNFFKVVPSDRGELVNIMNQWMFEPNGSVWMPLPN
ncbi:MAG: hypothetical protein ABIJ46_01265 [bacterium]